jgi:hypothetical protein
MMTLATVDYPADGIAEDVHVRRFSLNLAPPELPHRQPTRGARRWHGEVRRGHCRGLVVGLEMTFARLVGGHARRSSGTTPNATSRMQCGVGGDDSREAAAEAAEALGEGQGDKRG